MSSQETSNLFGEVIIYEGHKRTVCSVAFSPKGSSLVSGSDDGTICIWDLQHSSGLPKSLKGHTRSVNSVTYSPLGSLIASGSFDGTIRLWDTNTFQQVGESTRTPFDHACSVTFSPDGNIIASGSNKGVVQLWNAKGGGPASKPFRGHSAYVHFVSFLPDGTRMVSGSGDNTIHTWDVERGIPTTSPPSSYKLKGGVRSIDLSPDGSQIAAGLDNETLQLLDARSGVMIGKPYSGHTSFVLSVAFSPDGTYIASGSDDQTVRIWDIRTGGQVGEPFYEHITDVWSVSYSPCGTRVASGSYDGKVIVRHVPGNSVQSEPVCGEFLEDKSGLSIVESLGFDESNSPVRQLIDRILCETCPDLSFQIDPGYNSPIMVVGGPFGDQWAGKLRNGTKLAIRACRASTIERFDEETLKRTVQEVNVWSKMKHKNVHQLLGVAVVQGPSLGMISEQMENDNLHEYMRKHPCFDRHQMYSRIALGLAYMHQRDVIHGDLKALNILISSDGVPKLSNFGFTGISEACLVHTDFAVMQPGSARWTAPELLSEGVVKTKQSDIYALGMTLLEITTGNVPYPQCRWDFQVLTKVLQGGVPNRPMELKANESGYRMWELLISCWDKDPSSRPSAREVIGSLALISTEEG